MEIPTLIYCAAGNARFAQIALDAGYKFGAQLPGTVYHPVYMADQNWKKPNREAYMKALSIYRPYIASVLDWEREEQLPDVLGWAEDAAQFVEVVMIIPKVQGGIELLPRTIGGKSVRLGYSVPTKYSGTSLHAQEFSGWPVHLLGGSPKKQMIMAHYVNVVSADGNYASRMAMNCQYFSLKALRFAHDSHWPRLNETDGVMFQDAYYEAFRRSCENIMIAWKKLYEIPY